MIPPSAQETAEHFRAYHERVLRRGGLFKHETYGRTRGGHELRRLTAGSGGATCEPDPALWWERQRYARFWFAAANLCEGPQR